MRRKLTYLVCFIFVLGLAGSASADLLAQWRFEDNAEDSVGGLHWDPNGVTYSTDAIEGSKSASLDGVSAYLTQASAGALNEKFITQTVSLWFKADSTMGTQVLYDEGGSTNGVCIRINNGLLEAAIQNRHSIFIVSTAFSSPDWTHVALTFDRGLITLYVDGTEADSVTADFGGVLGHGNTATIGWSEQDAFDSAGGYFGGLIDDVRIYSEAMTAAEVQGLGAPEKASSPDPADGAQNVVTPLLQWQAGVGAAFHDVYFGTNPTPGTAEFIARQPLTPPMYFHMAGFDPGVTYYWRIDEVEADGTTINTGYVWSFTALPLTANNPDPAHRERFVDTEANLRWDAGSTGITHDVYFGTDEAEVAAGTGGTSKGNVAVTDYDPGSLARGTTYFWRIDEVEADTTTKHPGDVWRFTTRPVMPIRDPNLVGWWKMNDVGTGTVIDYSGYDRDGTLHGDALLISGYDGEALELHGNPDYVSIDGFDGILGPHAFSITAWLRTGDGGGEIMGWGSTAGGRTRFEFRTNNDRLRAESQGNVQGDTSLPNETWMHVAVTVTEGAGIDEPDVKLYLNAQVDNRTSTGSGNPLDMAAGYNVTIGRRHSGNARWLWGLLDDVRLYDKELTQAEVEQIMLRPDPYSAWGPRPANGSISDVEKATSLIWSPGELAAKHDVYLASDADAVMDADTSDMTGVYQGRIDPNTYTPTEALDYDQTYYWRVDEYNTDASITRGKIWSFTVGNFLIIDDFEDYDDFCNRIFYTWRDGWGYSGDVACGVDPYGGNGTGSTVGYLQAPYAEQTIVNNGIQSMPMEFDNTGANGKALYSETDRTFDTAQDWTRHGVKALTLYFRGNAPSVGSFNYDAPTDTYTITADGDDIWTTEDEFHFAFKRLSGTGSIEAQVLSVSNTHTWAKAAVMIRESLEPNSPHAMACVTPAQGVAFQRRDTKGASSSGDTIADITAPHWVKVERAGGNTIRAYHSTDGSSWQEIGSPMMVAMTNDVYIGLALTSHNTDPTVACTAEFSDVTMTGTVTGQWESQDIGIESNTADRLYVAVEDSTGTAEDVPHPDPNATISTTWQEWNIDMQEFADAGVDLTSVKKIYIGVGDRDAPAQGGTGTLYVDDIYLYRPRCVADIVKPAGDFNNNCVVDYPDLEILANNWLWSIWDPTGGHDGGGALVFGASTDYVAIEELFYQSTGLTAVSASAWIRTDSEADQYIISFDRNEYYRLEINGFGGGPGQVGWDLMTEAGQLDYGSVTRVDDGLWHHVVGVFDNGTATIYIDGIAEPAATLGTTYGSGNLRYGFLGANSEATGFDDPLPGGNPIQALDDMRVYDYALSAADVTGLAQGTADPAVGPILWYKLDEASGGIAADSSGNGYDGHLRGLWFEMNMHDDTVINFKDYALVADNWLEETLWP